MIYKAFLKIVQRYDQYRALSWWQCIILCNSNGTRIVLVSPSSAAQGAAITFLATSLPARLARIAVERMRLTRGDLPVKFYGEIRVITQSSRDGNSGVYFLRAVSRRRTKIETIDRRRVWETGRIDWCHEKKTQSVYREVYHPCKLQCLRAR